MNLMITIGKYSYWIQMLSTKEFRIMARLNSGTLDQVMNARWELLAKSDCLDSAKLYIFDHAHMLQTGVMS